MVRKCQHCDKSFSYSSGLTHHVRVKHKGVRYQCDYCIKSFTTAEWKRDHMEKRHGISGENTRMRKTHNCPECGKAYVHKDRLQAHREAEHFNKRYQCQFCDKQFKYQDLLLRHLNQAHKRQESRNEHHSTQLTRKAENKVPLAQEKMKDVRHYLLLQCATPKIMCINGQTYITL